MINGVCRYTKTLSLNSIDLKLPKSKTPEPNKDSKLIY